MKGTETSSEGLSPSILGMQRQVPGGLNQANVNTTHFNADKEDNVLVLRGEEWEDLEIVWKFTSFNGFSCE